MRQPVRPRATPAQTSWNVYGSGAPVGITYGADTLSYTLGTAFTVTQPALSLTEIRIFLSSGGGAIVAGDVASGGAPITAKLYAANATSDGATGATLITGVSLTAVTLDMWNTFTLGTPFGVTAGVVYYATVWMPSGRYSVRTAEFTSSVSNGPITLPADGSLQGDSGTVKNGTFNQGQDAAPSQGVGSWYGIDVGVSA